MCFLKKDHRGHRYRAQTRIWIPYHHCKWLPLPCEDNYRVSSCDPLIKVSDTFPWAGKSLVWLPKNTVPGCPLGFGLRNFCFQHLPRLYLEAIEVLPSFLSFCSNNLQWWMSSSLIPSLDNCDLWKLLIMNPKSLASSLVLHVTHLSSTSFSPKEERLH